jgi:pyruvate dehydrogenase (quinone)
MSRTVADAMVDRLIQWGIRRVYGYPGDGINGLMGSMRERQDRIRFVQTRHEELAAFMASAHWKFTGETGVCMATSGPGANRQDADDKPLVERVIIPACSGFPASY